MVRRAVLLVAFALVTLACSGQYSQVPNPREGRIALYQDGDQIGAVDYVSYESVLASAEAQGFDYTVPLNITFEKYVPYGHGWFGLVTLTGPVSGESTAARFRVLNPLGETKIDYAPESKPSLWPRTMVTGNYVVIGSVDTRGTHPDEHVRIEVYDHEGSPIRQMRSNHALRYPTGYPIDYTYFALVDNETGLIYADNSYVLYFVLATGGALRTEIPLAIDHDGGEIYVTPETPNLVDNRLEIALQAENKDYSFHQLYRFVYDVRTHRFE